MDWLPGPDKPAASTHDEWLNRATANGSVRRTGTGRMANPYRFRLPNEADAYLGRGELPPLRELLV